MFSIIIPCYDQAQYLPEAIESALAQTVKCEIIVINDGSTDDSLAIAKSYEKHGVKVVNQVNKGLPSARNTGIMNATGEYVLPLDADDILLEHCVETMQQMAEQYNPDIIAPSFKNFGINDSEIRLMGIPTLEEFKSANRLGYFSAIKRSVLLAIGGYNPKMTLGYEDWSIWFDIFRRGYSLCVLQDILVLYRTKERSMLTEAQKHHEELFDKIKKTYPDLWPTTQA